MAGERRRAATPASCYSITSSNLITRARELCLISTGGYTDKILGHSMTLMNVTIIFESPRRYGPVRVELAKFVILNVLYVRSTVEASMGLPIGQSRDSLRLTRAYR